MEKTPEGGQGPASKLHCALGGSRGSAGGPALSSRCSAPGPLLLCLLPPSPPPPASLLNPRPAVLPGRHSFPFFRPPLSAGASRGHLAASEQGL